MAGRNVASARRKSNPDNNNLQDEAYEMVKSIVNSERSSMWTSVDIDLLYQNHGGIQLTRKKLVEKLVNDFSNDLILLSSPGLANVLVFRKHASTIMKITESDDDEIEVKRLAKRIRKEILDMKVNTISETDKQIYR